MEYIYFFVIIAVFIVLSYILLFNNTKQKTPMIMFMSLLVLAVIIVPWLIPTCYENICDEEKKKCPKCPGCE